MCQTGYPLGELFRMCGFCCTVIGRAGTFLQRGAFLADGADLLAYVENDVENARESAEENAVPYFHDSLDEALQKHEVVYVSICTPAALHLEQAMFAMRAGCHVPVEKPITSTLEDAMNQWVEQSSDSLSGIRQSQISFFFLCLKNIPRRIVTK